MSMDKNKKEKIIKGMKRSKTDLQKRYGDRWKEVMYATATKQAQNEETNGYEHKQTYLKTSKNKDGKMQYHRVHATMKFDSMPKSAAASNYKLKNHPLHKKLVSQGYEASNGGHDTKDSYYGHKVVSTKTVNEEVEEALNIQARLKKSRLMKRIAPKLARMRKVKAKRLAPKEVLLKRAQKTARNILRKKLAGERGENYKELSPSAKKTVDNLLDGKDKVVKNIVRRILPSVRRKEQERVRSANTTKNEEFQLIWEKETSNSSVIIMRHPKEKRHVVARKVGNNVVMRFKEGDEVKDILKKKASAARDHLQSLGRMGWKIVEDDNLEEKLKADKKIKNIYYSDKTTKHELQKHIDKNKGKKSRTKDYYKNNADVIEVSINEVIRKTGNTWTIFSKDGSKKLGSYDSEEAAKKRLRQIEYFKNVKEEYGAGEMGTDKLTKKYMNSTPGQYVEEHDGPTVSHIELPAARENYVIKMMKAGKTNEEIKKTCRVTEQDIEHIKNKLKG